MKAAWCTGAAVVAALVAPAVAQPADVPALIALVDKQPAGMDKAAWKEKRRDAVKKLGASKDRRAVPTLMAVARAETFDIVGEYAIEGLGLIGDAAAVPLLQEVVADEDRDPKQRELARKALGRLGAPLAAPVVPTTPVTTAPPDAAPADEPTVEAPADEPRPATSALLEGSGADEAAEVPDGPPDDALAAYERITFAVGGASLAWDSLRDRSSFDADVAGSYARRLERPKVAWGVDADARVLAGVLNPEGAASSRGVVLDVGGRGDARYYLGPGGRDGVYGFGQLAARLQTTYVAVNRPDPAAEDTSDNRLAGELQLALGVGYGRILDVGAALRVRRVAEVLEAARALGRPIDDATARRLQLAWWGQRHARSGHARLTATVAILRSAGVMLGDPDVGLTYELLEVLRDGQLDRRAAGLDVNLGFGEGYLLREDTPPNPLLEDGRVEQALLTARYARQLGTTAEVGGEAFARRRLLAAEGAPVPWAVGATARWRAFRYGDHLDPLGVLDLAASVGASDDDLDQTGVGTRLAVDVGYTLHPNLASALRVGGTAAVDAGELFLGVTLAATYGLADGAFAVGP